MARVLLLTSSARGHAIAQALARSAGHPQIIHVCVSAHPGIRAIAAQQHIVPSLTDFPVVCDIAQRAKADFAICGPEDPIVAGISDALAEIGIPTVGPTRALAQLEGSKAFARELLRKHGIDASPRFRVFTDPNADALRDFMTRECAGAFVVKYDALKGGKGVKVSGEHLASVDDGIDYARECIRECGKVVVEEKLDGCEFSLLSFVSGDAIVDMPIVADHKRAQEGDRGSNTGGMGTITDRSHLLPFVTEDDRAAASAINRAAVRAVQEETGEVYHGILYGGYMAVRDGVRLIEFNVRFGDPEALNLLSLFESDFLALCSATLNGTLSAAHVRFARRASVCKYVVPAGYPDRRDQRGQPIVLPSETPADVRIYLGDVAQGQLPGQLVLGGARAVGVVGLGQDLAAAERASEDYCNRIRGPVEHRRDIGTTALLQSRINRMCALRPTSP